MSNQKVYQFIIDQHDELLDTWTAKLKEVGNQEDYQLTNHICENICKDYIDILLLSTKNDEATEEQISELALRAVQLGLSLKLLSATLSEFWKLLYETMVDLNMADQDRADLILEIDSFFNPINTEILNQYSISWEKTVTLQKIALQELSAPLIPVFEHVTVMPLVGTIDTERAKHIMENLLNGVVKHRSQVVLIDITGVPVVDTMVAHHIIQASEAVRLVGAKCLLVGIRPEIAQTIVNLGIDLSQVITKNTLQKGIQTALEMTNRKIVSLGNNIVRHPKIPILKLYNCLLVSIQWELDDQTALHFQEDLLNKIYETGANGVVIDLTSVDMIDSFIAKVLGDVITMSKLMGAKVVLTGIQPAVAVTLIELGISLEEIETALDLEQGLETLKRELGE